MTLDLMRHIDVVSPYAFGDGRIDVIGVGATGSRIARSLVELGFTGVHAWDFDKVERHNLPNQAYGEKHLDLFKVEALLDIVKAKDKDVQIIIHAERVDGTQRLGDVVFLLTDTMASRKEIWQAALRYKPHVKLVIETRMGADSGRIYAVNPSVPAQVRGWESTLYSDDVAEVSACGTSISVGPTADAVAGFAVWQFIRWLNAQEAIKAGTVPKDLPEHEFVFSLRPMMVATRNFD